MVRNSGLSILAGSAIGAFRQAIDALRQLSGWPCRFVAALRVQSVEQFAHRALGRRLGRGRGFVGHAVFPDRGNGGRFEGLVELKLRVASARCCEGVRESRSRSLSALRRLAFHFTASSVLSSSRELRLLDHVRVVKDPRTRTARQILGSLVFRPSRLL